MLVCFSVCLCTGVYKCMLHIRMCVCVCVFTSVCTHAEARDQLWLSLLFFFFLKIVSLASLGLAYFVKLSSL